MGRDATTNRNGDLVHITTLRLSRDQHDRLKAIAAKQERTVSQHIRFLVTRHLEEAEAA